MKKTFALASLFIASLTLLPGCVGFGCNKKKQVEKKVKAQKKSKTLIEQDIV